MLEKVSFVCSKCGSTFSTQEKCQKHEKECIPAYNLEVFMSVTLCSWVGSKAYIHTNASIYRCSVSQKDFLNKEPRIRKTMYCHEDDSETEIDYSVLKQLT